MTTSFEYEKQRVPMILAKIGRWGRGKPLWLLVLLAGALAGLVLWMAPAQSAAPVSGPPSQAALVRCDPDPLNSALGQATSVTTGLSLSSCRPAGLLRKAVIGRAGARYQT